MAQKVTLETSDLFERDLADLNERVRVRVRKALLLFVENPRHPSLHVKKMQGQKGIWEARVTRSYRFTFSIAGGVYYLLRVGPHDIEKNP